MFSLTSQQQQVATASPASRQLVTAGPGTGKTHTLVARLQFLIDECDLGAGDEVLVLSFSRAAVREIRARLREVGEAGDGNAVRRVRAQTFDSFATALLGDMEPEGDWQTQNYEARIEAATALLRDSADARQSLSDLQHILADEVQDLVGVRSEMVGILLEVTPQSGWSLFGDPAQSIYNFGLEDPQARKVGAWALLARLHRVFGAQITVTELTVNHRATSPGARKLAAQMAPIGSALGVPAPNYEAIRFQIENELIALEASGTVDDAIIQAALRGSERRKTAVLCRNNGEALMLSRALWEQGIAHHYRRGATERALPAWIADVLGDYQIEKISKDSFLERCGERCPDVDADRAFSLLRRLAATGGSLDLERLTQRIREGNVPDELCDQPDAALTISTVHRAKGLEFERVYLLCEPLLDAQKTDWEEELRIWYVALTRPRSALYRIEPIKAPYRLSKCERSQRWRRTFFHKTMKFNVADVEVRGDDSHKLDPAGAWGYGASVPQTQDYIRAQVRAGDAVNLRLVLGRAADAQSCAHYAVYHGETFVGLTCEEFGRDLRRVLARHRNWEFDFPPQLEKLRVDAVDTVAGRPDTGRKHGLGERGLWLRVRVGGLGHFGWDKL